MFSCKSNNEICTEIAFGLAIALAVITVILIVLVGFLFYRLRRLRKIVLGMLQNVAPLEMLPTTAGEHKNKMKSYVVNTRPGSTLVRQGSTESVVIMATPVAKRKSLPGIQDTTGQSNTTSLTVPEIHVNVNSGSEIEDTNNQDNTSNNNNNNINSNNNTNDEDDRSPQSFITQQHSSRDSGLGLSEQPIFPDHLPQQKIQKMKWSRHSTPEPRDHSMRDSRLLTMAIELHDNPEILENRRSSVNMSRGGSQSCVEDEQLAFTNRAFREIPTGECEPPLHTDAGEGSSEAWKRASITETSISLAKSDSAVDVQDGEGDNIYDIPEYEGDVIDEPIYMNSEVFRDAIAQYNNEEMMTS